MNTTEIMNLALKMANFDKVPADSGVWVAGNGIKRALFAIDASTAEILLAKQLGYDLLIAHHPVGPAKVGFPLVVRGHVDQMVEAGVPRDVAERAAGELVERLKVRAHPANYFHDVDAARMLGLPLMNIHLPLDQVGRQYLLKVISGSKAKTVGSLVARFGQIPEFEKAETKVELMMGKPENPVGKCVLVFAAGTNGGYPVAKAYFDHGADTVVYLHVDSEELSKLRRDCTGNLIVLGHMAGDSVGINQFLRKLAAKGVGSDTLGVIR
jgi:hypothetical protein